jgi:[ribosomal protein S5]-alanine N-acetyltransferase
MGLLTPWLIADNSVVLSGKRVELRTPTADHFAEWRDLRLASRSFLQPWEPTWDDTEYSRTSFRDRIAQYRKLADKDLTYSFFIFVRDGETLCGGASLSNVRRGVAQMATLGYWIGAAYARQGLMTDSIHALLRFAFSDLALHRIEAACLPRNEASIRLLESCGFKAEGYAASYLKIAGRWEDHILFAKVNGTVASASMQH